MTDDPTRNLDNFPLFNQLSPLIHGISTQLVTIDGRLGALDGWFEAFEGRVGAIEQLIDSRLRETRPIWESVQAEIGSIRTDVAKVNGELGQLRSDVTNVDSKIDQLKLDLERGFRQLNRQFDHVAGNLIRLEAYTRDVDTRVIDLESKAS